MQANFIRLIPKCNPLRDTNKNTWIRLIPLLLGTRAAASQSGGSVNQDARGHPSRGQGPSIAPEIEAQLGILTSGTTREYLNRFDETGNSFGWARLD